MPAAVKRARPPSDSESASDFERRLAPPISLKPSLRASLREYRDHVSETDLTETEAEDAEAELGEMLTSVEQLTDDANVDASLAALPQTPLRNYGKGKGVDPAERCLARSTEQRSRLYAVKRLPIRKRVAPGGHLPVPRATRRIVSPTESICSITKCIDSLATSPTSAEDEKRVSSSLLVSPDTSATEPLSPVPRSPSPVPDSEPSEDEVERDWPTSPLAYKLRGSVRRRRAKVAKRRAVATLADDRMAKKGKRWHEPTSPTVEKQPLTFESLESFARQLGLKLVPASPKATSDDVEDASPSFQIPGPVKEVDDEEHHVKAPLASPIQIDTLLASSAGPSSAGPSTAQPPRSPSPLSPGPGSKRARRYPAYALSSDSEKPASKHAKTQAQEPLRPRRREAREGAKRSQVRVVRERYAGPAPKSKHTSKAPLRHGQGGAGRAPQSTPPAEAPPTSVPAYSTRFLRRKVKWANRPVSLHRPAECKTLSGFHKADKADTQRDADCAEVIPGHAFVRAHHAAVVHRRVRRNMLLRHRERTASPEAPPDAPSSPSAEDDEVERDLLPPGDQSSDIEMLDSEEIEASLASSPGKARLNAARKRPPRGSGEVAERAGRRATLRADELSAQAGRLKEYFAQRSAERHAARARKDAAKRAAIERFLAWYAEREEAEVRAAIAAAIEEERAEHEAREAREAAAAAAYAEERAQLEARGRMRTERLNLALRRERVPSAAGFVAPGQRMRAATTPIRTFAEDRAEAEAQAARAAAPAPPEELSETEGEDEALDAAPASDPGPGPAPRTPSPSPAAELPMDSPPGYEFPFFPIIRPAPAPAARVVTPPRPLRRRASDPPVYTVLRERTTRSPSPPPPYNAETDAHTVIPPVFHADRERVDADLAPSAERRPRTRLATPESPTPARQPRPAPPRRTLPGHLPTGASFENIGASASSSDAEEQDSSGSEDEPAPIVRSIGRWLGLWQ